MCVCLCVCLSVCLSVCQCQLTSFVESLPVTTTIWKELLDQLILHAFRCLVSASLSELRLDKPIHSNEELSVHWEFTFSLPVFSRSLCLIRNFNDAKHDVREDARLKEVRNILFFFEAAPFCAAMMSTFFGWMCLLTCLFHNAVKADILVVSPRRIERENFHFE
jgi:hypothetical protein